ncbi:hypothetical protein E4T56_gene15827 [Termitomyces sp. T112]|nr:hypothetical protein E4T56_gene15827 [Termitomyces sp. T112]
MVCIPSSPRNSPRSSPSNVHQDWQTSEDDQGWPAPLETESDSEDEWSPQLDPSILNDHNGYGHGYQAKIDYISYLISKNPHIGCRFCEVEDVSLIENSIPIWALQIMQPRPEGFIWEDPEMRPSDPDGLGHICLGCYKRVLELQLERPAWGKANEGTEDSRTNGWDSIVQDAEMEFESSSEGS